ncbi:hypothetical protein [Corynebacterium spheniscorum]|uniref:Uncharacterized protein n=1 Tax=Corynebacterium spheniscorum TaxID=185761 RepID=A0A1I2QE83_9CORY|nr:hypothetical protein [Corynebacterium spheniscorum]KAA8719489.1 hypothetical protein F4V56_09820 [Corynebacterium spheniscorum]SFG26618.1 hypothetical protein SAMN05660282_00415 [Corynebacterium spheniscorum]
MTTNRIPDTFRITQGAHGLMAVALRVQHLNSAALARVADLGNGSCDVFFTTPFGVTVARRVRGTVSRDGVVIPIMELIEGLKAEEAEGAGGAAPEGTAVDACELSFHSHDGAWPGALPPLSAFQLLDEIPAADALRLADEGRALARQFSGPLGPPASLLDQEVIHVTSVDGTKDCAIPMRSIFACAALSFIPPLGAKLPASIPRTLRVSVAGRWVRIDAPFGSVYRNEGLPLLSL